MCACERTCITYTHKHTRKHTHKQPNLESKLEGRAGMRFFSQRQVLLTRHARRSPHVFLLQARPRCFNLRPEMLAHCYHLRNHRRCRGWGYLHYREWMGERASSSRVKPTCRTQSGSVGGHT